jgi:hypothetical protein
VPSVPSHGEPQLQVALSTLYRMQLDRITLGSLGRSGGIGSGLGSSLTTSNGSFGELGSSKPLHLRNAVPLGCVGPAINVYTLSIDGFARLAEVEHLEYQGFL